MGGVKLYGGEEYLLSQFHYLISSETANTQKSEVFLLRSSSGNMNALVVVTCQYLQIY